jgi:hypothetical protein
MTPSDAVECRYHYEEDVKGQSANIKRLSSSVD